MKIEARTPKEQTDSYTIYDCTKASYITVKGGHSYADHEHEAGDTLDIMAGKGRVTVDDPTLPVEAPCVTWLPPNRPYTIRPETDIQLVYMTARDGFGPAQ